MGFLTKATMGVGVLLMCVFVGSLFIVEIGNNAGISQENFFDENLETSSNKFRNITSDSSILGTENSNVDNKAQDVAQLTGAISSTSTNMNIFTPLKSMLSQARTIIGFNPFIVIILSTLLVSALAFAFIKFLRKGDL